MQSSDCLKPKPNPTWDNHLTARHQEKIGRVSYSICHLLFRRAQRHKAQKTAPGINAMKPRSMEWSTTIHMRTSKTRPLAAIEALYQVYVKNIHFAAACTKVPMMLQALGLAIVHCPMPNPSRCCSGSTR